MIGACDGGYRDLRAARSRQIDPDLRPLQAWNLTGGVSALVTALMAARPDGSVQTLVVRQYGAANLRSDPLAASHEYALLDLLHAHGSPGAAPALRRRVARDPAGSMPGHRVRRRRGHDRP